MDERLKQQLDFTLEIDKEKNIFRQTHLSGHGRRENDAEHAWHMAIMAYLLREYANEPVDIAKSHADVPDPRYRRDRCRRYFRIRRRVKEPAKKDLHPAHSLMSLNTAKLQSQIRSRHG